jgi:hypothetical protein
MAQVEKVHEKELTAARLMRSTPRLVKSIDLGERVVR